MNLKQLKEGDKREYILYDYIYIQKQVKLICIKIISVVAYRGDGAWLEEPLEAS